MKYLEYVLKSVTINDLVSGFISRKQKPMQVIYSSVDVNGLVDYLLDEVIDEALNRVVMKSENPFDNSAKDMLYPLLVKQIKLVIADKIDAMRTEDAPAVVAEAEMALSDSLRSAAGEPRQIADQSSEQA